MFQSHTEDEKKQFSFFCALNKSVDRKVLYSNVLQFDQCIKAGTRLIVLYHEEKRERRFKLYLDGSKIDSLPRGDGDQTISR
mgnify:CR=1 FL=1|jgi:hypothetical protein